MNDGITLFGKDRLFKTPNTERLGKRGVFFARAYRSSSACNPSRFGADGQTVAQYRGLRQQNRLAERLPVRGNRPQVFRATRVTLPFWPTMRRRSQAEGDQFRLLQAHFDQIL